jgi:hypothetical protein
MGPLAFFVIQFHCVCCGQAVFFGAYPLGRPFSTPDGFKWMGVTIVCVSITLATIYFPMWGGMLAGPMKHVTEEDYYLADYSREEITQGLHQPSSKFAGGAGAGTGHGLLALPIGRK